MTLLIHATGKTEMSGANTIAQIEIMNENTTLDGDQSVSVARRAIVTSLITSTIATPTATRTKETWSRDTSIPIAVILTDTGGTPTPLSTNLIAVTVATAVMTTTTAADMAAEKTAVIATSIAR